MSLPWLETGCYTVTQVGLEFMVILLPRFLSSRIIGMNHHARLIDLLKHNTQGQRNGY